MHKVIAMAFLLLMMVDMCKAVSSNPLNFTKDQQSMVKKCLKEIMSREATVVQIEFKGGNDVFHVIL